ncbi:coiled-coil domain-containing protein 18-like isoform X3 [Hemiscyllium ocellatum]|uniref:coiled-coil domain-containing protein 18-like isoform X3 n=1 Tax=Hemiscyllium ocellatum TaxID=170820 RepID=UPI0029664E5B|nr:coiled-coil domain-containing protein 18-like isoform X3 [Hemiscyllium ocellatum]
MVPAMNNRHVTMAERMTPQKCVFSNISPTSSFGGRTSQVPSTFAIEQENEQLWKKLSTLREDNARLVSQNHSLVREIESIQAELTQSKVKFCHLEPSINEKALHISQLNEDILGLEAEVEAQEKVLRVAEEKLEESQWMVAEKEKLLEKLSDECKRVKNELYEQGRRRKRAEQQRNEALYSAEELSAAFKQYKEKTTEELLMFQANEQELQRRLDQYDKDRVELFEKCTMFEKELESKNEEIRIIMGQSCDVKLVQHDLEAKNAGLFSVLSDSKEKIKMLEGELTDKEAILKERDALRVENAGLRGLTTSQSEKLLQVNKELEVAKLEVKNLESVLQVEQTQSEETDSTFGRGVANLSSLNAFSNRKENGMKDSKLNAESSDSIVTDLSIKLAMKDAEIQKLKSSLMNSKFSTQECGDILGKSCVLLDRGSPELMSNRNKKDDRRSMERHLEEERCRPIEVERLQTQLLDAEATISMLQTQLTEQINNFEQIQEQLSEKSKYIGNVEEELRKTKSQLAIMEKQLEEKTIVCTANAVKAIEHEQEIAEKSEEIIKLEKFIAEQHQENIIACEHIKKIQTEQYQELEQQIEILQSQLEEKEQQLKKQKQTISNVQEEINAKQSRIESLEFLLEEAREEIKKQDNRNNAALKSLQNQTDEEASKVKDLENALAVSKEELKIQSQQFEDIREQQKKQIEKKSEEVLCLQKQLKISAINLKESNEQNMQLQQTLVQYQQMLQQGTARIGELEDHQAMLERQVSQLEQELYKQKMAYTDELSKTEGKLLKAYDGQDSKHQQVVELTSALKEIKTAMDNCKDETTALEKELLQLRRDSANKDIQLNQLEMTLRNTQIELDKKSDQVLDLEENLHKIETDRRNALQENQKIEAQLRNARSELHDTLSQLKELRDVLQTAQNNMEEKKNVIEELTHEIRQYKNELQDRNVKIIEMDQALKDRQWELQQRAAQLTQLDMNVHEHKTEMEQKMICLQSSLEKSELNVKEHSKQVETLDGKLQLIQEELREKDFKLLQKEQQINQLKNEVEGKDVQIDKYEQMLKDKDQCIVKQQKDVFDESQQVRIVHEQMQRCHLELRECQQHLAQTKREVERLSVELDETIRLSQEKISILKERNAHSLPTIIETSETQKSSDQLLRLNQDLEKAQECILHLESELKNQKEVINAAEESLIIKESEIARLQVKISGFERAMGKQQLQSPTLEAQNESNNRKDYTSQLKSFYPLTRNMNRPFSAHDTYGTDIGSALQSLNYSNRIRETLEQSFIEESISLDDTMDASCAGKSENPTLFSQSANSEAEENLELTNLISNSNMDTLSEMLNQLIAMEQTSTKLDSPVNKSSGLSNEQITSKPEDCSTGMYRIQDQDSAHCNLTDVDLNVQSHMPVPLK